MSFRRMRYRVVGVKFATVLFCALIGGMNVASTYLSGFDELS